MILKELINHFENKITRIDICTPAFRKSGYIKNILDEKNEILLNSEVSNWKVSIECVLEVDL